MYTWPLVCLLYKPIILKHTPAICPAVDLMSISQDQASVPPVYAVPPSDHVPMMAVAPAMTIGANSFITTCPRCAVPVKTATKKVTGQNTLIWSAIGCFLGSLCCLCLVPFCMDSTKDVEHTCPACELNLGVYKRKF